MRSHCCNSFLCGNAIWDCPNLHLILSACRAHSPDNSAADQPSTCSRTTIKSSLAGEEHGNLEKETKGHPPQRSCQILRPSILRYTCHPETCVAGISHLTCSHQPPPQSPWAVYCCNPGRKPNHFLHSHYQSENGAVTAQLSLYKTFSELHCHELVLKIQMLESLGVRWQW